MTRIYQNPRLGTCGARQQESHSPVRDIGVVTGRLERFVFDQEPRIHMKGAVDSLQTFFEPALPLPDVSAARVIGPIRKPQHQIAAFQMTRDRNAL
jgi:hypothetical protein